ncbi:MAG: hypothetical protein ACR2Q4_09640 [Geminicoccaceae bacterium]
MNWQQDEDLNDEFKALLSRVDAHGYERGWKDGVVLALTTIKKIAQGTALTPPDEDAGQHRAAIYEKAMQAISNADGEGQ